MSDFDQPQYEMFDPIPEMRFTCPECNNTTPLASIMAGVSVIGVVYYLIIAQCINTKCENEWSNWTYLSPDGG